MAAATPALRAPMVSTSEGDVLAELRAATSDLEAIGAERAGIEATAKAIKERDNIMAKVMAAENPGAHEALFERELAKYDEVKAAVARNVSSQADVLGRLRREREAFARAYDVDGWRAASAIHAEATRTRSRTTGNSRRGSSAAPRSTRIRGGHRAAAEETEAWVESRRREKAQPRPRWRRERRRARRRRRTTPAAAAAAHDERRRIRPRRGAPWPRRTPGKPPRRRTRQADPHGPMHARLCASRPASAERTVPAAADVAADARQYPPQPQQAFAPFALAAAGLALVPPQPLRPAAAPPHGYR